MSQNDGRQMPVPDQNNDTGAKPGKDADENLDSNVEADAASVGLCAHVQPDEVGAILPKVPRTTLAGRFAIAPEVTSQTAKPSPKQATLTQMGVEVNAPTHLDQDGCFVLGDDPTSLDMASDRYANQDTKVVVNGAMACSGTANHPLYQKAVKEGRKLWGMAGCSFSIECPGLPINLRNGAEEHIDRMADDIDHCRPIEPFRSNVIQHVMKRRARGTKCDSDEDAKDAEKMPHEFDYSSPEEDLNSKSESEDKADYETPPCKKRRSEY